MPWMRLSKPQRRLFGSALQLSPKPVMTTSQTSAFPSPSVSLQ